MILFLACTWLVVFTIGWVAGMVAASQLRPVPSRHRTTSHVRTICRPYDAARERT